jgi:hypothetical protein
MRRCRDRKARAQALAAARPRQEMGKQLTARRGEPAGTIAAVERREASMNCVRIARAGPERYLAVDKDRAKVIRETLIKDSRIVPLASTAASGAMACRRASAAAASKTAGLTPWTVRNASAAGKAAGRRSGAPLGCGKSGGFAGKRAIGGAAIIPLGRCKSIRLKRHKAIMESVQLWTHLSIDIRQKSRKCDQISRGRLATGAALPVPCRRYWRSRGARAGFPWRCDTRGMKKGKQAGDVADLKTCDQHGEF